MKRIRPGFILPSAAYTISPRQVRGYVPMESAPQVGDVVYGRITHLGQHGTLENKQGRIHMATDGTRAVFVYGNRYAPDAFEGVVPDKPMSEVDLLARSGLVGVMRQKNSAVKDPSKVRVLGHVVDEAGEPLSTLRQTVVAPKEPPLEGRKRAKMILNVGTSMNSGKSTSAMACCWALAAMGYRVRATKATGTASLKDILHMQDAGAERVSDFTHLGYPSTYLLDLGAVVEGFKALDAKYASNPQKFWVVEFADGILQRETAALLRDEYVRSRIHRLVFSAADAFGALGGLRMLKEEFGLEADAVSGRCTSSPLMIDELSAHTDVTVFDNLNRDLKLLGEILL
jgi:hypothetical protein